MNPTTNNQNFNNPNMLTNQIDQKVRIISALAYLLFFIPLVVQETRNNQFARHHANNALVISLFSIVFSCCFLSFLTTFLNFAILSMSDENRVLTGIVNNLVTCVYSLLVLIVWLTGVIKAYSGQYFNIPILSNIKIIK